MISGQRLGVRWSIKPFNVNSCAVPKITCYFGDRTLKNMQTHRIGVLTSGGDCPGLNAVLRGVTKAAEKRGWQVIGFRDGFEGLLPPAQYMILDDIGPPASCS